MWPAGTNTSYVLITRPKPDAFTFATTLQRKGYRTIVEPMIAYQNRPYDLDKLKDATNIIVSSPEGARQLAQAGAPAEATVWAVGRGSAEPILRAGHRKVKIADGTGASLLQLIIAADLPTGSSFFQIGGRDVVFDFRRALTRLGHDVERETAYEARSVSRLTPVCELSLLSRRVRAVTFFSARAAFAFRAATSRASCQHSLSSISAIVLSERIAAALEPRKWRDVRVAAYPSASSLIAALEAAA